MAGFSWRRVTDEQLLDMRLCDLPIRIAETALAQRIKHLYTELAERGLRFRPHTWLSAEWFSPDGVPGFAIPFYLAHPRLMCLGLIYKPVRDDLNLVRKIRNEFAHNLYASFEDEKIESWCSGLK